jgi:choline dehydrogenase-like flavoprotein
MRDVIIIGAGGGGPVVAKELAAKGLDVLLLEAGNRNADSEHEWRHYEDDANNPILGHFRVGPVDRSKPPWFREIPQNAVVQQAAGVGGTTQHYFGNCPRAYPGTFMDYKGPDEGAYDTAHRFPFSYREMVPYYEWVEYTLPVQTAPMGTKEEVFFRGAEALGILVQTTKDITMAAYRPQENAILQPEGTAGKSSNSAEISYPKAKGCTFCGHCYQGCIEPLKAPRNLKAKRSTDNSYVPMALTADRWSHGGKAATLIANAFVIRINADETSTARSVTWRNVSTGEVYTEEAKVVVMAGGCIDNPRLWLNSGLPNPNDQVGRGMTDHFLDFVAGVLPFDTGLTKGPGSNARVDFPSYGGLEQFNGMPGFVSAGVCALSDAGTAGFYDNGLPHTEQGADLAGRLIGPELKTALSYIDRVLVIIILTDDDVEAQNRVALASSSSTPPDQNGPVPRIEVYHRKRTARTMRNREFLAAQAVRLARGAGATKVYRFNCPPILLHMQSSMRMGLDPSNSVVDPSGEARWVKRLFIADSSVLSNALGGSNPTLTNQSLATRTSETIFQRYFGGSPWVGKESPIQSTDDRITRAILERRGLL